MKRRKNMLKILMSGAAIICIVLFVPWQLIRTWITPLPDSVQIEVDKAIDRGLDGITVYINRSNETTYYAAGWNNRDEKIPADPKALFKIASISKLYIAVATTKMIDRGLLSLDDALAELLPEYADRIENADQITLRLLLQHRSGIPEFIYHPDFPWDNLPIANRATLELVLDTPADFEPNEQYRYSNTNYVLIGEILDKTLAYSHHRFITEEVLRPFGLNNTYNVLSEVDVTELSSGYFVGYDKDIKPNDYIGPGGSMIATLEDVGIFLRALNDGSLLNDNEQAIYTSIYKYEHTGLLPGYSSIARYYKDIDAVVIQFVNTSGGNTWPTLELVYNRIVKILRKEHTEMDAASIQNN